MFKRFDEEQALQLLARHQLGRLGCVTEDGPYVVPINYDYSDGSVYSHSLPGVKISALRRDPRACLQVDEIDNDILWRSVLAFGSYEEIVKPTERSETLNRLLQHFPMLTPVESALADDGDALGVIIFKIRIQRITGISEA